MRKFTMTAKKKYGWSYGGLEVYMNDTWRYVLKKVYSVDAADRIMRPLEWWVKTGRASLYDCKKLIAVQPYIIGRILIEKDLMPYDDIIRALKEKIEMKGEKE